MSEPQPTSENTNIQAGLPPAPALPVPAEPLAYRPISGWAIAGCVVGSFFFLLVAISAIVALFQGAPIFFPNWVMGIAILGFVISYYGQRHVQNSEGTRAGIKLAQIGMWLSVVSALVYYSYFFVTGAALHAQANAFLMEKTSDDSGFFPRLQVGESNMREFNIAFLLTQPSRESVRPEDEATMRLHYDLPREGASGFLSQFREGPLSRLFYKQLGKDAVVEPLGVQEWRFDKGTYKVYRYYRIRTKEVELETLIPTWSIEAAGSGQGRRWFINANEIRTISKKLTPLGESVSLLRGSARNWLMQKMQSINEGEVLPGVAEIDKTPWDLLPVKKEVRNDVLNGLAGPGKNRCFQFTCYTQADDPGKWEQIDGKIRFFFNFGYEAPKAPGLPPFYRVEGTLAVESRNAVDPATFQSTSPAPTWELVRLSITNAGERKGP